MLLRELDLWHSLAHATVVRGRNGDRARSLKKVWKWGRQHWKARTKILKSLKLLHSLGVAPTN